MKIRKDIIRTKVAVSIVLLIAAAAVTTLDYAALEVAVGIALLLAGLFSAVWPWQHREVGSRSPEARPQPQSSRRPKNRGSTSTKAPAPPPEQEDAPPEAGLEQVRRSSRPVGR